MKVPPNHHTDMKLLSTLEDLFPAFECVVARAVVEPGRDIESLRRRRYLIWAM